MTAHRHRRVIVALIAGATVLACKSRPARIGAGSGTGGAPGTALVSGGVVSTSPHYTFTGTLGQGAASNASSQSSKYQLRGGVVGATQSP